MLNIYRWSQTDPQTRQRIFERAMLDISEIKDYVARWMEIIRTEGDAGIVRYAREFDKKDFDLKELRVTPEEIEQAYRVVNPRIVDVLKRQISISRQNAESKARQETVMKSFVPGFGFGILP